MLDPRTGAVLALASVPATIPTRSTRDWAALCTIRHRRCSTARPSGLYPPGSTFKIVTAADALDAGVVTPRSTFTDTGGLTVGNFTVHNDEEEVTGTQDLAGAFALSSNVDFAQIALKIGVDRWFEYAGSGGSANRSISICPLRAIASRQERRVSPASSLSWASDKRRCW